MEVHFAPKEQPIACSWESHVHGSRDVEGCRGRSSHHHRPASNMFDVHGLLDLHGGCSLRVGEACSVPGNGGILEAWEDAQPCMTRERRCSRAAPSGWEKCRSADAKRRSSTGALEMLAEHRQWPQASLVRGARELGRSQRLACTVQARSTHAWFQRIHVNVVNT